jgi:hypothetical protein
MRDASRSRLLPLEDVRHCTELSHLGSASYICGCRAWGTDFASKY